MPVGETPVYMVGISGDAADELISFIDYQIGQENYVPVVLRNIAKFLLDEAYGKVQEASLEAKDGVHYGPSDEKPVWVEPAEGPGIAGTF